MISMGEPVLFAVLGGGTMDTKKSLWSFVALEDIFSEIPVEVWTGDDRGFARHPKER